MNDDDLVVGFVLARRFAKPYEPDGRRHPKMPSRPWRIMALICIAVGSGLGWLLFRTGDSGALVLRTVLGAVVGLVIGMCAVETVWRRRRRHHADLVTPIGDRR